MRLDTSTATLRNSHKHLNKIFTSNSMVRAVPICSNAMSTRTSSTKPACRAPAMAGTYQSALGKQGGGGEQSHMTDGMSTTEPSCGGSCAWGKQLSWQEGCACPSAGLEKGRDYAWATSTPIQPGDFPVRGRGNT